MTLLELAHMLNAAVNGPWLNIRGPDHSSKDRSLGICFDPAAPDGFFVNSLAGDDESECRAYVKSLIAKLNGEISVSYEPQHAHAEKARIARARVLWREAGPPEGTAVESYLRSRRCSLEPVLGADVLRFHPICPFGSLRIPAMVALITDAVTGEPIGVHRTAIKDDGSGKRELGEGISSKMMLGVARRGAVRLHAAAVEHLGIAEGIENALSASQVFGTAVWATLSRGGVGTFPVLKGIKRLTVFADNDTPGLKAAEQCCRRYQLAGIDAEIRVPDGAGADWNDFVVKEKS